MFRAVALARPLISASLAVAMYVKISMVRMHRIVVLVITHVPVILWRMPLLTAAQVANVNIHAPADMPMRALA